MAAPVQKRALWAEGLLLLAIAAFCIFPFYWMVTTSLKTQIVALQSPPACKPSAWRRRTSWCWTR